MDLRPYVESIQNQLVVAAPTGAEDAATLTQRMLALDAAIRLAIQDALSAAAEEITCELAPGSVELRLRGGELEFAVTPPPARADNDRHDTNADYSQPLGATSGDHADADDGAVARINLRMPESLKARVERAAATEGLSVNSWLVRAAAAAVERADSDRNPARNTSRGKQHYTGWAR